ncbi:DMT family transporter [Salinactinospora qingdaonensis]|uniref:Magnesium transporter NIPA n=1 Tax=Salinactinospora qingdaonensis TaxID=702744 RepID=A0ABP7G7G1_9ACTN
MLSCLSYAAAAVAQWRLAVVVPEPLTGRRPLSVLLRHPLWWASAVLNAGRAGFQVGALGLAPLTVIQPLGVLTLVLSLPWAARIGGRTVTVREKRGAVLAVVALVLLLAVAVTEGQSRPLSHSSALLVTGGTLVLLGTCAWGAGRLSSPAWRSYLLAAGAGIAFGVSSALAKTTVTAVAAQGLLGVLHPAAAGTAMVALTGLLLAQAAYQGMELGAPLGVTTVANPVAAALTGIAFMGESYTGGWMGAGAAVLCAVIGSYGIRLLTVPLPSPSQRGAAQEHRHVSHPASARDETKGLQPPDC